MCGIIGYIGKRSCRNFLLEGLEKLEYRGYDSAGIAVLGEELELCKAVGPIAELKKQMAKQSLEGCCGVGHTRWATHGKPTLSNCHPHQDQGKKLALVHNGIIENYRAVKDDLQKQGVEFCSETDTEVIVQKLAAENQGDLRVALEKTLPQLEGSFALAIVAENEPEKLFCARRQSPLLAAKGEDGMAVASDVSALLDFSREIYELPEDSIAVLTAEGIRFWKNGEEISVEPQFIRWDSNAAQKNGFEHFMLKEIHEEPKALRDTLNHYVDLEKGCIRRETMPFSPEQAKEIRSISLAACGTAYHAAVMGQQWLEQLAGIPARAHIASEFRYSALPAMGGEVFIAVSQSGETADTLAALRYRKQQGCRCIALSNVIGSTIAREADCTLFTLAGPEIAVASTKAYVTQLLVFAIVALDLAQLRGKISGEELKDHLKKLAELPQQAEAVLANSQQVQDFAELHKACGDYYFIGRLLDQASALEAALKLKEVSYLHAEAYAAGELKHGTLALVDESCLCVVLATQSAIREKTLANLEEVRARGAQVLVIGTEKTEHCECWTLPESCDAFAPILSAVYGQLLAYYTAKVHERSIDKPRNLAKSVTVE